MILGVGQVSIVWLLGVLFGLTLRGPSSSGRVMWLLGEVVLKVGVVYAAMEYQ